MWWWGVCAGASCCADVLPLHETRAHVYDDLRPLMLERASSSASAATSSRNTTEERGETETPPGMYTARHRATHDLVALKVFRKKLLSHQETRRRLRREVQILSMCKGHPNLLTLYGVYSTSTTVSVFVFRWRSVCTGVWGIRVALIQIAISCVYTRSLRSRSSWLVAAR